jgi:ABC-type glutathione transport system ATPase component
VHNALEAADIPEPSAETVEVRARTSAGDVVIRPPSSGAPRRTSYRHQYVRQSSATGLSKSFGDHLVLDGIDVDVGAGTIFALPGTNGVGKTTKVLDSRDTDRRRCRRDAVASPH